MTMQPVAVLFTDAELWAITTLRAKLATRAEAYKSGVVVSNAVPTTRPARLVTVRRDGGSSSGVFDRPRFGVNVWAATEKDVADLAALVSALFLLAAGDGVCVRMRQTLGPSPIADAQPRRYLIFEATLRGSPLT
jgi:hypothetical protein